MATKTEQFDIFSERFRLLRWDFNQGNKTVDQIHASLLADCRELIATPPVEEVEEVEEKDDRSERRAEERKRGRMDDR